MGAGIGPEASVPARLVAALGRLGATPSEIAALALLASAALAGLGVLWWAAVPAGPGGEVAAAASPDAVEGGGGDGQSGGGASGGDQSGGGRSGGVGSGGEAHGGGSGIDVRQPEVVVHVAGRVHAPGLYELPGGARVADAVTAAGGALPDALLDHLNLARPLTDGEQLRVPGPDDPLPAEPGPGTGAGDGSAPGRPGNPGGGPSAWRPDGTLDLNLATEADLQELPGIGPVLASRIVAFREQHGAFTSVGELRLVSGIGERTFQSLADLVSV